MRYLIDLPVSSVQAIKLLIESGKYENVQSFALTAIENQLYLEKQPIEHFGSVEPCTIPCSQESGNSSPIPFLALRPALGISDIVTVPEPSAETSNSDILWALYNRIFPVKVALRVLANLQKSNATDQGYIDLFAVTDAAADVARKLSLLLSKVDKKSHRIHGEKLSTGLPGAGNRASERFKSSFVGTINSKGHIEGAPAVLRFVNIRRDGGGRPQIGITESGFEFALLENPILDKTDYSHTFYDEEIAFYIRHVSEKLQKEYQLSFNMLQAIKNGNTTPDGLTKTVLEASLDLSNKEAQAIRSSAVSRLSELGMLTRRRNGLNVTYSLSANARTLLATSIEKKE